MRLIFISLFLLLTIHIYSQDYKELAEQAFAYIEDDDPEQAEAYLKKAMKVEPANPQNAILLSNLGTLQRRQNKKEEALISYTFALNLMPNNIPILLNRASLYLETGNENKAYVDYSNILDLNPDNKEALLFRGYINSNLRNYKEGEKDYLALLSMDGENVTARLGLATLYQRQKEYAKSLEVINKLIADYPHESDYYLGRADIEMDMGYLELALADTELAIDYSPDNPEIYVLRGKIYLQQQEKSKARTNFEIAINLGISRNELQEELKQCK